MADQLVPISGKIKSEALVVTKNSASPLTKARDIYRHMVTSIIYDKSGEGWGNGDAIYACDIRKGNCTDFHSLFIGEVRSLRIPARFIMGFLIPKGTTAGSISGYHCWAEFYLEKKGWVPVDASEAHKNPSKTEDFFGGLDEHRIQFTIGRDIHLPKAANSPLNYMIYPQVEVDDEIFQNFDWALSFKVL